MKFFGTDVPVDHVPRLQTRFEIEEQHYKYRYKTFDGYFPTKQWILRKNAIQSHPTADDVYVIFCFSEKCPAPRGIIAVELTTWKEAIEKHKHAVGDHSFPSIVGDIRPLI